jgi:hypothetical protein
MMQVKNLVMLYAELPVRYVENIYETRLELLQLVELGKYFLVM